MPKNQESEDLLSTAEDVCQRVRTNLQKRLAPDNPLELKTTPVFVRCIKEALMYRSAELGETAINLFRRNALVSAATITRSLLETTALFERLRETCDGFIKKHKKHGMSKEHFQKFDNELRKIILGSTHRLVEDEVEPHKVPSLINSLGTRYKIDLKKVYDTLCQFSHPNFAGVIGPFAYWYDDHVEFFSDYHRSPSLENAAQFKQLLVILLLAIEKIQKEIEVLYPELNKVCGEYSTGNTGE